MESKFAPCAKKSYQSKKEAAKKAKSLRCSPDVNIRQTLRPYKCKLCEFWHLTKHVDSDSKIFFRADQDCD